METEHKEEGQLIDEDEAVLAVVKRHWIGLAGIIGVSFTGMIALLVLAIVLGRDPGNSISNETYGLIMVVGVLVVAILLFMLFLVSYIYGQSKFTVTDKSLVEVLQRGLFNRKIARLSMSNVEDVSVDQRGMMASVFNYGTLTVQTAGEEDNFIFPLTPNPNHYAEIILDARQAYAKRHPAD